MNRTASIRIKGINLPFLRENSTHILMLVLLLVSILAGALSLQKEKVFDYTRELFGDYISDRADNKFSVTFAISLFNSLRALILIYLAGTSAIGIIVSPFLLAVAGFNYGALSGYIYKTYGLSGIVFNLFVFLLPTVVLLFSLLLQANQSLIFSKKLAVSLIKDKRPVNLYREFRLYCNFSLVLILPVIFSSVADSLLYNLFKTYFTF